MQSISYQMLPHVEREGDNLMDNLVEMRQSIQDQYLVMFSCFDKYFEQVCGILWKMCNMFEMRCCFYMKNLNSWTWERLEIISSEQQLAINGYMECLSNDLKSHKREAKKQRLRMVGHFIFVMQDFDKVFFQWQRLEHLMRFASTHSYCMFELDLQKKTFMESCQRLSQFNGAEATSRWVDVRKGQLNCVLAELFVKKDRFFVWGSCWEARKSKDMSIVKQSSSNEESAKILDWLRSFNDMLVDVRKENKRMTSPGVANALVGHYQQMDDYIQSIIQDISRLRSMTESFFLR